MAKVMMDSRFMANSKKTEGMAEALSKVEVREYDAVDAIGSRRRLGVVGQTATHIPDVVTIDGMGYHFVDTEGLICALVSAVQELSAKVDALSAPRRRASAAKE